MWIYLLPVLVAYFYYRYHQHNKYNTSKHKCPINNQKTDQEFYQWYDKLETVPYSDRRLYKIKIPITVHIMHTDISKFETTQYMEETILPAINHLFNQKGNTLAHQYQGLISRVFQNCQKKKKYLSYVHLLPKDNLPLQWTFFLDKVILCPGKYEKNTLQGDTNLNIWVVNNKYLCDAFFPEDNTWGIIISASVFQPGWLSSFGEFKTIAHALGHQFGMSHYAKLIGDLSETNTDSEVKHLFSDPNYYPPVGNLMDFTYDEYLLSFNQEQLYRAVYTIMKYKPQWFIDS